MIRPRTRNFAAVRSLKALLALQIAVKTDGAAISSGAILQALFDGDPAAAGELMFMTSLLLEVSLLGILPWLSATSFPVGR